MHEAPPHVDEEHRLAVLRGLGILDTPPEARFDRITRVAAALFEVPIALVGLIDADRQWYKSCIGIDAAETDRSVTFCAHAILREGPMVLEDTHDDPFFRNHPMVTDGLKVRFYAGMPLRPFEEMPVGTLCIVDTAPRAFGERERELLVDLAQWAEREMGTLELARTNEALAASEAHVAGILASVAEGVATFDSSGAVLSFNPAGESLFGRSAAQIIGKPITDLVAADDRDTILQLLARRVAEDVVEEVHVTVRGVRGDGQHFLMEVSASELAGSDGEVFIAVARDVSEVSALRQRLQLLLDAAGEGIIGVDVDGLVTFANPAAAEMLGHASPSAMVGVALHDAHHEGPWQACDTYLTLRDGVSHRADSATYRRLDGTQLDVQYSCTPLVDDGTVTGAVLVFSDVTARREVERLKDQFVSVVSHELRTPLTSIQGSLGLVAGGVTGELPEESQQMVDVALANVARLVRLVNDILDLERISSGQLDLAPAPTDARELAHAAVSATTGAAMSANVRVEIDVDAAALVVDADRVIQALTNLIGNAIKFSPAGAAVCVRAEVGDDDVTFLVEDRGRGIPADMLESVFERFQQVDASDRRERGGSGLGLAITRSIARQHGGDVTVTSTVGEGSTFRLALPRSPRG